MSRTLSRLQAAVLGVVVLAAIGLGAAGVFAIGSRQLLWSDTFHVQVGFPEIRGVEAGTRVRVQGIDAGEVAELQLPAAPGQFVLLRLRLDGRFRPLVRADASARIANESLVGGKVIELDPGSASAEPVRENGLIASRTNPELSDVLARVDGMLQEMRDGKGSLGKLLRDEQAHGELVRMLQQSRGTLEAIKQDADAIKSMPIVRSYVKDANKLLVRPDCSFNRQSFAEADLFEPGNAVLTAKGREELDKLVPWLEGLKHKGSEVVIASYADVKLEPRWAATLTQKQSESVCNYLKNQHSIQKMGWFSRRDVTPLGLGVEASPRPETEKLPVPRVEIIVFVPQS